MIDWWVNFGRDSLIAGGIAGLIGAALSWWQRWSAVKQGKPSPARHRVLFGLELIQAVSFFTLILTFSAMAAEKMISRGLMWYLIVVLAIGMAAAVYLGQFAKDRSSPDDITGIAPRTKDDGEKRSG
jgi:hypothetical protein